MGRNSCGRFLRGIYFYSKIAKLNSANYFDRNQSQKQILQSVSEMVEMVLFKSK